MLLMLKLIQVQLQKCSSVYRKHVLLIDKLNIKSGSKCPEVQSMEEKLIESVHLGTAACGRSSHRSTQMRSAKNVWKKIERNRAPSSRLAKSVDASL